MKIAYLILAHNHPQQLLRLINTLEEDWTSFFVHIDKKVDIRKFDCIAKHPQVTLIRHRIKVYRAGFSHVRAMLTLMKASLNANIPANWHILLSGVCYPIRNNQAIYDFLFKSNSEHINFYDIKRTNRITKFHLERLRNGKKWQKKIDRLVRNYYFKYFGARNYKKYLGDYIPYKGSQWWGLSKDALTYVLDTYRDNPNLFKPFHFSLFPSEHAIQTILANSKFRPKITFNLTYDNWDGINCGSSPNTINHTYLTHCDKDGFIMKDEWRSFNSLFARKFSPEDKFIFDKIDAKISGQNQ